jgi:hypothetical protein
LTCSKETHCITPERNGKQCSRVGSLPACGTEGWRFRSTFFVHMFYTYSLFFKICNVVHSTVLFCKFSYTARLYMPFITMLAFNSTCLRSACILDCARSSVGIESSKWFWDHMWQKIPKMQSRQPTVIYDVMY